MKAFSSKGFTLIELLVVIGILGILAGALITTIDPFEQLKKGRDTVTRDTALSYHQALIRYYATHGILPWELSATDVCASPATTVTLVSSAAITSCTTMLEDEGELKKGFGTAIANNGVGGKIKITSAATGTSDLIVCFAPEARSNKVDSSTIYINDCKTAPTGANTCGDVTYRKTVADGVCWQAFK